VVALAAASAAFGLALLAPRETFAEKEADAKSKYVADGVREEHVVGSAFLVADDDGQWRLHVSVQNAGDARARCAAAVAIERFDGVLVGRVMRDGVPVWGTTRTFDLGPGESAEVTIPAPASIVRQITTAEALRKQLMEHAPSGDAVTPEQLGRYYRTPIASYGAAVQRIVKM
jgi:hypothetical protein